MVGQTEVKWYPWLKEPYHQLISQYRRGRGHHALLLHGIAGCGKSSLLYALSRWLMCQHPVGDKSCGECHSCQLMLAATHPDYYILSLEKGKNSLGIDTVRQVIDKQYDFSQQGGAKVVFLPQAERLTEAAANALLKTLEEPPANTYFLLSSEAPGRLLPTLRSRCVAFHLPIPDETLSLAWLHEHTAESNNSQLTALRLTAGAPLAALALLQPEHWQQRARLYQAVADALPQHAWLALLSCLNHDNVAEQITWLCALLLDAIKLQHGAADAISNLDSVVLLQQLASALPTTTLEDLLSQWIACRHQLLNTPGLNRELMLTRQLCLWCEQISITQQ